MSANATLGLAPREAAVLADKLEAAAFADLYAAAPPALAGRLGLGLRHLGGATALLAPAMPTTMFNRVIGLGLDRPACAADLAELRQIYAQAGSRDWWLHWNPFAEPADGALWLTGQGFAPQARLSWAKMLRVTHSPSPFQTSLSVAAATSDQVGATAACIAKAFDMPPFMADWLAALYGRAQWRLYCIAAGAQVVGGACMFMDTVAGQRVAWLGMGAVVASQRRRGGQAAAMALRIADAEAAGCRWVATETGEPVGDESNPSLANMQRAGFERVASRLNFAPLAQ